MDKVAFCLDADPRPTCVLDLAARDHILDTHYENGALRARSHLFGDVLNGGASGGLHAWAVDGARSGAVEVAGKASLYAYTIDKRWRVIQWSFPGEEVRKGQDTLERRALEGQDSSEKHSSQEITTVKTDPSTLNRKLKDALADRDDATGRLSNLLKMMEMVDVGMFEYTNEGVLLYGNEAFHSLSGLPKNESTPMAWGNWVFEEDRASLTGFWTQLTEGRSCTFDMRWIGSNPEDHPEGQWVSAACVPTTDDAGNVTTISGCITDISAQKRSHMDAVKKAEALERAAASEKRFSNFITHSNVAFYSFHMDRTVR